MKISQTSNVVTMINVFTVEPEKQQQLIEIWLREGKQFEALAGFISNTLYRSVDGKRVINYLQWRKVEDSLVLSRLVDELSVHFQAISQADAHLYDVIYQSSASGVSPVTIEQSSPNAIMINAFTVEPEKQQQLVETWLREGKQFEAMPGFISATLHRSIDGKRVINYAQWEKAEDWLAIARRAGELFGHFRAISQSDAHLYEISYMSQQQLASPM